MSSDKRFQHVQSQIDGLRKHLQQLEVRAPVEQPEGVRRWERANVGLMTAFTGLLFIGSMLQWWATRDAIKDTHTSFEIGTRSWVVAKNAIIKPTKADAPNHAIVQDGYGLKDSRTPAISVELINGGRSPALAVAQNSRFEVLNSLPTDEYVMPPAEQGQVASKNVLAPDGTFAVNKGLLLTEPQFQDVTHGRQFLAAYGVVTYEDIFKTVRETKYCYFYDYITEKMAYCPHYNSAN
jgi:hypothetical protein